MGLAWGSPLYEWWGFWPGLLFGATWIPHFARIRAELATLRQLTFFFRRQEGRRPEILRGRSFSFWRGWRLSPVKQVSWYSGSSGGFEVPWLIAGQKGVLGFTGASRYFFPVGFFRIGVKLGWPIESDRTPIAWGREGGGSSLLGPGGDVISGRQGDDILFFSKKAE